METKVKDLVILTLTFILKIANFDFVVVAGIHVSQTQFILLTAMGNPSYQIPDNLVAEVLAENEQLAVERSVYF